MFVFIFSNDNGHRFQKTDLNGKNIKDQNQPDHIFPHSAQCLSNALFQENILLYAYQLVFNIWLQCSPFAQLSIQATNPLLKYTINNIFLYLRDRGSLGINYPFFLSLLWAKQSMVIKKMMIHVHVHVHVFPKYFKIVLYMSGQLLDGGDIQRQWML